MKVLFLVDKFPTFSETFIRDQIAALRDEGIDVVIYPQHGAINRVEAQALIGYESYQLIDHVIDIDTYFEPYKIKRIFKFLSLLIQSIWSPHIRYYFRTLSFNRYGELSKSLRLFFRVHFLLKHQIDIIHAHFGPNGNAAVIYKQLGLPIKLFVTFHGYDMRLGLNKGGQIYHDLFQYADGIFAISDYNYQHLVKFGASKAKLIVLPNGIDISFFKSDQKTVSSAGPIRILSVARLVEDKGLDMAIKALGKIIAQLPELDINYTIVGDGDQCEKLEQLIKSEGLSKHVTLVGYKTSKEVKDYMMVSDLFLLSSRAEALPTVLLEAQACGLVVLATDVGAVKDMVKGGLVVAPTLEGITDGLLHLIRLKNDWKVLSSSGTEYVSAHYDLVTQTKKLLTHYRN